MTEPSIQEGQNQIKDLLLQAEKEELKYDWKSSIDLLEKAKKYAIQNEFKNDFYDIYFKLGELYYIAADCGESEDEVLKYLKFSKKSFQDAKLISEKSKIEKNMFASSGYINLLKYISKNNKEDNQFLLENARKNFIQAGKLYRQANDKLTSFKMNVLACMVLNLTIGEKLIRLDSLTNFDELLCNYKNLSNKIWENLKETQDLPEIYIYHTLISLQELFIWIVAYARTDLLDLRQFVLESLNKLENFTKIFEKSQKTLALFTVYSIFAFFNMNFGVYYQSNQFEQLKYLKQARKWLKKAEVLRPISKENVSLGIFYYSRFNVAIRLVSLGYFDKSFKAIETDMNLCIESISRYFPKIMVAHIIFYTSGIFLIGAFTIPIPKSERIDLVKQAQKLIESVSGQISLEDYRIYNLVAIYSTCSINTLLGTLLPDEKETSIYLQKAAETFTNLSNYIDPQISTTQVFYQCVVAASRIGAMLARNSIDPSEKITYLQQTLELLLRLRESKSIAEPYYHIFNLFEIGLTYYELGILTNETNDFKQSHSFFNLAIEYCKNKGYFTLIGSAYVNLARIEDHLGNFLFASENYGKAIEAFDQAIITYSYTSLGKQLEKLKKYLKAWQFIETAKSLHQNEDHHNARMEYEKASQILETIRIYSFEAPFYAAWAVLEKAEDLSKQNDHEKAAETYLDAQKKFLSAIGDLEANISKRKSRDERNRLTNLIKVARLRATYCIARNQIEIARLESKKGNRYVAAELYEKASSHFEKLSNQFEIPREKDELKAIFYFCKAWEHMEKADAENRADLYGLASELFEKASNIFQKGKMKKLSLANALFCSALEHGSLFDKTEKINEKIDYYKKIKSYLRGSSKNYQLGGFLQDAQWALATSTFFDGIWQLIQADNEIDASKKNQYLNMAINYLNTAMEIFETAGYERKKDEILGFLKIIDEEKAILASALNIIEKPEISASSVGISAPSTPSEISSSIDIEEMRREDLKAESEKNWHKRLHHLSLFMSNGICIYDHSFKEKLTVDSQLFSSGLTGISMLIQELTKSDTKVKIVEQEEITILLEHGKYLSGALITDEHLITLRKKLTQLIQEVEEFYQEELEDFCGELDTFSKIDKFVPKIFSISNT